MSADTFEAKTAAFLLEATHIGAEHPLAFAVSKAAEQLDKKQTIALFKEYVSLIKHIESLRPVKDNKPESDPLLMPAGLETRGAEQTN